MMKIKIKLGDTVRVGTDSPAYGWGNVTQQCIGKVTSIFAKGEKCKVDFPSQRVWDALVSQLIIISDEEERSTVNTEDE